MNLYFLNSELFVGIFELFILKVGMWVMGLLLLEFLKYM